MKKVIFSALALSMVVLSCNKKDVIPNSSISQETENTVVESSVIGDFDENIKNCVISDSVKYFLNGKEVRPGTYDPANENLFGILHTPDEEMNGSVHISVSAHTKKVFNKLTSHVPFYFLFSNFGSKLNI
jgi:hypothetical protein